MYAARHPQHGILCAASATLRLQLLPPWQAGTSRPGCVSAAELLEQRGLQISEYPHLLLLPKEALQPVGLSLVPSSHPVPSAFPNFPSLQPISHWSPSTILLGALSHLTNSYALAKQPSIPTSCSSDSLTILMVSGCSETKNRNCFARGMQQTRGCFAKGPVGHALFRCAAGLQSIHDNCVKSPRSKQLIFLRESIAWSSALIKSFPEKVSSKVRSEIRKQKQTLVCSLTAGGAGRLHLLTHNTQMKCSQRNEPRGVQQNRINALA